MGFVVFTSGEPRRKALKERYLERGGKRATLRDTEVSLELGPFKEGGAT